MSQEGSNSGEEAKSCSIGKSKNYQSALPRSRYLRSRSSIFANKDEDAHMFQKFVIITAWACILPLAFATLTHVGFVYSIYYMLAPFLMRTGMRTYVHFEHVIAFAFFGALFTFAYPRRVLFVFSVVFISATALEYLQTLTPDRHGTLIDAFEKLTGGALGIFAAQAILWFARNSRRFQY
jgi:hypothetical protein